MGEAISIYNYLNSAEIAAEATVGINLKSLLEQSPKSKLLPANAVYIKSIDDNCDIEIAINDTSGDKYRITAEGDLLIQGVNIWNMFISNLNTTNAISAENITATFYKV